MKDAETLDMLNETRLNRMQADRTYRPYGVETAGSAIVGTLAGGGIFAGLFWAARTGIEDWASAGLGTAVMTAVIVTGAFAYVWQSKRRPILVGALTIGVTIPVIAATLSLLSQHSWMAWVGVFGAVLGVARGAKLIFDEVEKRAAEREAATRADASPTVPTRVANVSSSPSSSQSADHDETTRDGERHASATTR